MHHRHPPVRWLVLASLGSLAGCGGGGGGPESGAGLDTTPPTAGVVMDGLGGDVDSQTSTTTVSANWAGFADENGVSSYQWAIGTTPGGTELMDWTPAGSGTDATTNSLALSVSTQFFVAVRAYDAANNVSPVAVSDGVTVQATSGGGGGGGGGGGTETLASSISQWGITWRFSQPKPVGQFCNGDWWVVGPVSIVEISPPCQVVSGRVINGAMLNPTNVESGYDGNLGVYQASLNAALGVSASSPLAVAVNSSLVSTIAQMGPAASGSQSPLATAAVLTVLASTPAADAFRPPYGAGDKSIRYRESDLDYSVLGSLAPAGTPPSFAETAPQFQRVWLDHISSWGSRYLHPVQNMPDYGRNFTSLFGTGALLLQLNATNAQKRDLLVNMVQIGLDHYRNVENGNYWDGVGGQGSGRKMPILLAGAVLHDASMLAIGTTHPSGYYGPGHPSNRSSFGEDCQTFYVQQTSPGVYNWGFGSYSSSHNGLPEWGNQHTVLPGNDHASWTQDSYRICCTANAWVGQVLVARIMGLRDEWNHPALFDYMDRYMQIEPVGTWTRRWEPWHESMWTTYRNSF